MRQSDRDQSLYRKFGQHAPNSYQVAAPRVLATIFSESEPIARAGKRPKRRQTTRLENPERQPFSPAQGVHETLAITPIHDAGMKWIVMSIEKECADRPARDLPQTDAAANCDPATLMNLFAAYFGYGTGAALRAETT